MQRRISVIVLTLLACPLYSQFVPWPAWSWQWDSKHGVFRAKEKRFESQFQGIPNVDFSAEAAGVLKDNPSAPLLCAAVTLWSGPIDSEGHKKLRDTEVELCKAHAPSAQQLSEVNAYLNPPPPSHHAVIANKLRSPDATAERWVGGVYYPPPAGAMAWARGEVVGRDYRADLEVEFNADPLTAARVCTWADTARAQTQPVYQQQQATLKSVCAAFPDQKIDAAYNAWHSQWSRAWLNGLMNSSLDEAASYTPDVRQQKEEDALIALSKMGGAMTTRFDAAVRIVALAPDDIRGGDALLQHMQEATWSSDHNADPDVVIAWLTDKYKQNSAAGKEALTWKRGLRNWLVLNRHLDEALSVAQEIAVANERDQHGRDVIYVAAIERALGNRASYDKLMNSCPAPDGLYVRLNGAPSRPVKYCEDIVAEFARVAREQLHGTPAGDAFAEMVVETNRVKPTTPQISAVAQNPARTPEAATDDWFLSVLNAQEARVRPMTKVQREEASASVATRQGVGTPTLETAAFAMFLEPWRESAAALMLGAANREASSQFDKPARVRKLVTDYYRKRAAGGADAAEWKRGLRAVLLFNGDYNGARALSNELLHEHDVEFEVRDKVIGGLLDRIDGDRRPLDAIIANCPPAPKEERERWDVSPDLDKSFYCRSMALWDVDRALVLAPRNTLPHAYFEFLQESAAKGVDPELRMFAIVDLQKLNLDIAKQAWLDLLNTTDLPQECGCRVSALWGLAWIAEQQKQFPEAIQWIDKYMQEKFRQPAPFTPALWSIIADIPERSSSRSAATDPFELRFRASLAAGDFANARRTIENAAAYTQFGPDSATALVFEIRWLLVRLADAEVAAGQRQEPLRILGFVARNPLNSQLTAMVDDVRKKLNAEPKREDRPWDSPAREFPKPPKQEPAKASKVST